MPVTKLLIEKAGAIATITLNRPDHGNAIDMDLARELARAAADCAGDDGVRCVVLTGAGRMFSVGGDVGAFADAGDQAGPFLRELADVLHGAVLTLATMNKPLVTVVNGPAAGAGMSLAILGDLVIASDAAHFTAAYTAIGLTPDGGMSWLLPRLIGVRAAQRMILTNVRVPAAEAVEIGLVTRIVPAEALTADAGALAAQLAAGPIRALGGARGLLLASSTQGLAAHLDVEAAMIATAGAGAEAQEGIDAFLGRRTADFSDR
jgi:2-(1,2-epoxy-1,2-dihydrophenyl)acetyl-CoA isomerase